MSLDIAERIITEELSRLGWQETGLASRRKGDPAKLQKAARVRGETTLSVKHISGDERTSRHCHNCGTPLPSPEPGDPSPPGAMQSPSENS